MRTKCRICGKEFKDNKFNFLINSNDYNNCCPLCNLLGHLSIKKIKFVRYL